MFSEKFQRISNYESFDWNIFLPSPSLHADIFQSLLSWYRQKKIWPHYIIQRNLIFNFNLQAIFPLISIYFIVYKSHTNLCNETSKAVLDRICNFFPVSWTLKGKRLSNPFHLNGSCFLSLVRLKLDQGQGYELDEVRKEDSADSQVCSPIDCKLCLLRPVQKHVSAFRSTFPATRKRLGVT